MSRLFCSHPRSLWRVWVLSALAGVFCACAGTQKVPEDPRNLCNVFRENKEWYGSAYESYRRWGVPIPVTMAIMYQESAFQADVKPPRTTCLWLFPGPRPSSAAGYAQGLDSTWDQYKSSTGNRGAEKDDFADAIDFIAWYCYISHKKCKIAGNDAYNLYLAYHEGHGGFNRGTYENKSWLKRVATKVKNRANDYESQLAVCEPEFQRVERPCFWPFF